jgi:aspartyl-tRNA(Asn)/glutamyl-tRNA(Gln) amidotransferase subunit C
MSMTVSEKDVERVAELANLELTGDEKSRMLHDLNSILGYLAQLNELDTSSVVPMSQVGEQLRSIPDSMEPKLRPDAEVPSLARDAVLASAPDTDGVFFKVPKVIER